jgi:hypothetical protein
MEMHKRNIKVNNLVQKLKIKIPERLNIIDKYINGKCEIKDLENGLMRLKTKSLRKRNLQKRLKLNGLMLRSDSVLCKNYINLKTDDISLVINTMIEMDWLFKNTNYGNIVKQRLRDLHQNYDYYDRDERYFYNDIDEQLIENEKESAKRDAFEFWKRKNLSIRFPITLARFD